MYGMTWDKWASLGCQLIMTGVVCATAWIAWRTLRTWKEQMLGCSRFELARSILYNAQLLARGIQSYRSYASHQDRTPEGVQRSINEPAVELDRAFIQASHLFASGLLDNERKQLKAAVDELYLATTRHGREMRKPEEKRNQERLDEYDAVIWSPGEDDPFKAQVEEAVERLTQKLQPFVAKW